MYSTCFYKLASKSNDKFNTFHILVIKANKMHYFSTLFW